MTDPVIPGATSPGTTDPAAVQATGLYHIYREREVETVALRGADVTLERGSWTSVMGPSGSGKSTLVNVLAGFLEPAGGSVLVGGEDITRLPAGERAVRRRRNIGVVLQRDNLHPLLNVRGNVELALRLDSRPRQDVRERTDELLDAIGLTNRASQSSRTLSGGEMQRVAVAAALAPRPSVLLADELTGELDADTTVAMLDLLDDIRARDQTAILTATHNPIVADRADRRLTMRDGLLFDSP